MAHGRRRRLLTLSIAGCGVLVGHWLTYLVNAPDAGERTAILDATGHGYLNVAGELTSALLAFSIVAKVQPGIDGTVHAPTVSCSPS